jgi:Flp pilus assembly protein TadG
MIGRSLHPRIAADERGVTVVEFGIVAPALFLFLIGAFDVAHTLYMRATLEGIVQKTARDSGIETSLGNLTSIDDKLRVQVQALAANSTITITRKSYRTFSALQAARAEEWTDTNGNGTCDAGEPYTDANSNGTWNADGGNAGQGGAKDRTLMKVVVTYPRMFPLYNFVPVSHDVTVSATTVLQNQPYSDQAEASTTVRNCP